MLKLQAGRLLLIYTTPDMLYGDLPGTGATTLRTGDHGDLTTGTITTDTTTTGTITTIRTTDHGIITVTITGMNITTVRTAYIQKQSMYM